MKVLFLLFIFYLIDGELVTNATVEIYYDSRGGIYLNYEQGYVNQIVNHQNFKLSAGPAKATFKIKDHEITLLHYFPQPKIEEKPLVGAWSPMYGKLMYVGIFRGASKKDKNICTSVEKAKEYVDLVELGIRLYSANQGRIAKGNDLYISSKCLPISEELYEEANSGKINNALYEAAKTIDKVPNMAVRWFIQDRYAASWIGLAAVGSPMVVTNRNSNYWLICNTDSNFEDKGNGKVQTIAHEFGHSCGFHHGATQSAATTGTFTTFNLVDNYGDCANIMGNCATWDRPVDANQYMHMIARNKPEPWMFKYPEEGKHTFDYMHLIILILDIS